MVDAVERLVNLALYFADARSPVTREQVRKEVAGYPSDQDEDAFLRMFERDKDTLKASGFVLSADESGNYRLDARATYASMLRLEPEEAATLRAVGAALLDDASFPFTEDLRLALAKMSAEPEAGLGRVSSRLADEDPERQGDVIATLTSAATSRKRVSFGYTNSLAVSAPHDVEPYGAFLYDGRWYLVGRDIAKGDVRTYAVARMAELRINPASPKSPDFVRPDGFDVASFVRLPFQYGDEAEEFEAVVVFSPQISWRAHALTGGRGVVEEVDGRVIWRVSARSVERLARFVIENGPGLSLAGPAQAVDAARQGLESAVTAHG